MPRGEVKLGWEDGVPATTCPELIAASTIAAHDLGQLIGEDFMIQFDLIKQCPECGENGHVVARMFLAGERYHFATLWDQHFTPRRKIISVACTNDDYLFVPGHQRDFSGQPELQRYLATLLKRSLDYEYQEPDKIRIRLASISEPQDAEVTP